MFTTYPVPALDVLPFQEPLLHLPALGGIHHFSALKALRSIHQFEWGDRPDPTLKLSETDLFGANKHFRDAWRYRVGNHAIVIFTDRSCLLFKASEKGSLEALPFVFRLPDTVPLLASQQEGDVSNLIFDTRGTGCQEFGIAPRQRPNSFINIFSEQAISLEANVIQATLETIDLEVSAWVAALENVSIDDRQQTPVALGLIRENTETVAQIRKWFSKIC